MIIIIVSTMHILDLSSINDINGKFILLDNSFFELQFVKKKLKGYGQGVSVKSKTGKIDNENNINFSSSKIEFMRINIDEDYIDIFLVLNIKRVKSANPDQPNYYRIIMKYIGDRDEFYFGK